MKLVTASEMREIDRTAIERYGIPGPVFMENAGRGAAETILRAMPELKDGQKVAIFSGPGNNGGDGFVIARWLAERGVLVTVYILTSPEKLKGDALINYKIITHLNIPVIAVHNDQEWAGYQDQTASENVLFIDAIFGTGLKGEVRGVMATVINWLNGLRKPVWSVDIPSGLDADTGRPLGTAVKADVTITFGLPKIGQIVSPGPEFTGSLKIIDIGIPAKAVEKNEIRRELLGQDICPGWILPRPPDSHKGTYGHVLIIAGSPGKSGAAILTCLGALRSGAGLVTCGLPKSLNPVFETKVTEAMSEPLPETIDGTLSTAAYDRIMELIENKKVLAIGPGLSLHPETQALIRRLVAEADIPMVIDADAVRSIKGYLHILKESINIRILTPHPGEMGWLVGKKTWEIQENRLSMAEGLSKEYGVYTVLKGAATLIAAPNGETAVNSTGGPALASGGMGDVLTGMIAGFMAQGYNPFRAACLGVFCHGLAGDRLSGQKKTSGILATEVAQAVPGILATLRTSRDSIHGQSDNHHL
ncbi:MAG: NAD(P)H-hydrate dehydratase [Deltaproteobacteria bacterium]|nr:NAD(P)H-hydrate dehydratase [Deltaproteobacteria bacterium]